MKKTTGKKLAAAFFVLLGALLVQRAALCSVEDGDGFMEHGQYRKAIEAYNKELKKSPGDADILAKLGRAYDGAKWFGMSAEIWESYIEKHPDGTDAAEARKQAAKARRWLGAYAYYSGEELELVIPQLEKALRHDPDLFEANYWLGRALIEKGECEKAVAAVNKAAAMKPKDRNAVWLRKEAEGCAAHGAAAYQHYRNGYGAYRDGRPDEALNFYKKAVEANPNFARAYYWMARIQMESRDFAGAAPNLEKALELDPGNSEAKWFLETCRRELAAAGKGK